MKLIRDNKNLVCIKFTSDEIVRLTKTLRKKLSSNNSTIEKIEFYTPDNIKVIITIGL
jgi:hypothetical protein